MKNLINYKKTISCFEILILFLVGCSSEKLIQKVDNSQSKPGISTPQEMIVIKSDSINNYFGIKNDIIYSDKIFPPIGSKYDEHLSDYNPNIKTESRVVKDTVLNCFSKERYQELINLKEGMILLHMYTDEKGVIKEVVIITGKHTNLTTIELMSIINSVKGKTLTFAPVYVNYSYNMFGQSITFK